MRFLRTTSTARLAALFVSLAALGGGAAAITVAATSQGGAKPPAKPLASALHDALTGPQAQGVTARISFTNHLVDSAAVPGSTPLLSGASGRLWASSDGKARLELQSNDGDAQIVFDRGRFLVYDGSSNTAYRGQLPQGKAGGHKDNGAPPSIAQIQQAIGRASRYAGLSGAVPTTAAGQSAYEVRVTPRHGGQVSGASLVWDALRGVPLKVAVYARGDSSPVLALTARSISYGRVPASVFSLSPPKGSHVVDLTPPAGNRAGGRDVSGLAAVQRALPFQLSAPPQLAGKGRQDVNLLGSDGALVTYGKGLDGVAVIEQRADGQTQLGGGPNGIQLPSVSINGATGQELPTALGTVVRFTRGQVNYTVLGFQQAATIVAAARAL